MWEALPAWITRALPTNTVELSHLAAAVMIIAGIAAFISLQFLSAPYGRHGGTPLADWFGPKLNGRLAWCLQEAPSALLPGWYWWTYGAGFNWATHAAMAMLVTHYVQRAFVYPFQMNSPSATPLAIAGMAYLFCSYNGWMQGLSMSTMGVAGADSRLDCARQAAGAALWLAGLAINLHADSVLRALRTPANPEYQPGKRYYIPRGGAFRWVSGANYFGEILEWTGWALFCGTFASAAFAWFTFANVAPRAASHHRWYQSKFDDYPKSRAAVIPYLW